MATKVRSNRPDEPHRYAHDMKPDMLRDGYERLDSSDMQRPSEGYGMGGGFRRGSGADRRGLAEEVWDSPLSNVNNYED